MLFVISFTHWFRNSLDRVDEIRHFEEYVRHPFELGDFADAYRLEPEAERAGVRAGDIVSSVEGRPLEGFSDYYDFILLPNAQLGIAIGDVSGKGIPAALLMATLRAYLRGAQMIHHQVDLTEVMRNLNKLDGTVLEGHDRLVVLRERGIDIDVLPREVLPHEPQN